MGGTKNQKLFYQHFFTVKINEPRRPNLLHLPTISPYHIDSKQNFESVSNKIYPKEAGISTSLFQTTENDIFVTNSREIATKKSEPQYLSQGNKIQEFSQRNNFHNHGIKNTSNKNVSNPTVDSLYIYAYSFISF